MELEGRKKLILHAVVDAYISTGEPVGSKSLANISDLNLSSATLRNEMAELETMGYLEQPHVSAGRMPSDKGYRLYVDSMMRHYSLSEGEQRQVRDAVDNLYGVERVLSETSRVMSMMTEYAAVTITPRVRRDYIKSINLMLMSMRVFLLAIITSVGLIKTTMFHSTEDITEDMLTRFCALLNDRLCGKPIDTITPEVMDEMRRDMAAFGQDVRAITTFIGETIESMKADGVFLQGSSNMLNFPEFHDILKARKVISLFDDKQNIGRVISNYSPKERDMNVVIGGENESDDMKDLSVVVGNYGVGGEVSGSVGLIGPKRMDYERAVGSVKFITQALGAVLGKLLGEQEE